MGRTNKKYTQEEFEGLCREIHGDKYDYSCDTYKGMNIRYKFFCKKHGFFTTKPAQLIHQKQGCKQCYLEDTVERNKKRYVEQATELHGDKYSITGWCSFSERRDKVKCSCKYHGDYVSSIASLLDTDYGGCPRCKQLKEACKFIEKAEKVHGDKYSYRKEDYVCSRTLMRIWCNTHNKFFYQRPSAHLQGQNCPDCGKNSFHLTMSKTKDTFIKEASEIHGEKYDYSKVDYIDTRKLVIIICPKHGEFLITPNTLLHGGGCPSCSKETIQEKNKQEFITNSKTVFGEGTYDYSEVEYVNNRTKVKLKCNTHGEWFYISPNKHLLKGRSGGCPVCSKLTMNRWSFKSVKKIPNIEKEVGYFYKGVFSNFSGMKIGVTKNLLQREDIYRRDLNKYPDISFNYKSIIKTSYLVAFLIESIFKDILKPYFKNHNLIFGGKNEVYHIPLKVEKIIDEVIHGRYEFELTYLAFIIEDTKDVQYINFVNKLKEEINE